MLLQRGDGQQRIEKLQFKAPGGLVGHDLERPAVRRSAGERGDVPGRPRRSVTRVVTSGPGAYPLVLPQPGDPELPIYLTGPYRWRAVWPVDRDAGVRGPVQSRHDRYAGEDRSRSAHGADHGHDGPAAAGDRGCPDGSARGRRGDRPARVHVQPDELRPEHVLRHGVGQRHPPEGTPKQARPHPVEPVRGRVLPRTDVRTQIRGLHLREDQQSRRCEPDREAHLPHGAHRARRRTSRASRSTSPSSSRRG